MSHHHHNGKRNRERRSRAPVARWEWHWAGRIAVVVEQNGRGEVTAVAPHSERVSGAGKMQAADWLGEFLPRLTIRERYAILWAENF